MMERYVLITGSVISAGCEFIVLIRQADVAKEELEKHWQTNFAQKVSQSCSIAPSFLHRSAWEDQSIGSVKDDFKSLISSPKILIWCFLSIRFSRNCHRVAMGSKRSPTARRCLVLWVRRDEEWIDTITEKECSEADQWLSCCAGE